ncbi:MAG: T9SS type A sorting domain-containing protein [Elusimicrobia bacterium]|nr:T9SS type A sorting domain-containing protein [Elusimicrobiota bacterium]
MRHFALALTLFTLAGPRPAAAATGGTFNLLVTGVISGGTRSTGGALVNYSAIGGYGTVMTGGTLTMAPGILASVKGASLNLDEAHAFPTPYMPSRGHTRITFTDLPALVTIQVYSLSGRLVKTLMKNDSTDSLIWSPVVNNQGSALASGVYLFTITYPGFSKRRGKIMVIR